MYLPSTVSLYALELSKLYVFLKKLIMKHRLSVLTGSWSRPTWRTDGQSFRGGSGLRQGTARSLHETTVISNSKNVPFGSETRCRLTSKLARQRAR